MDYNFLGSTDFKIIVLFKLNLLECTFLRRHFLELRMKAVQEDHQFKDWLYFKGHL